MAILTSSVKLYLKLEE
jgi:AP-1 complex subunit beta-1